MNKATLCVLLLCLPGLTGCSVGMAAHGYPEPDLSVLRVGASRGEVELQPFTALKQTTDDRGYTTVVYEYHIGGEGSAGRAVGWAIADVLTLGLAEIVGTPVEAFVGEKYTVTVSYDQDARVASVNAPVHIVDAKKDDEVDDEHDYAEVNIERGKMDLPPLSWEEYKKRKAEDGETTGDVLAHPPQR